MFTSKKVMPDASTNFVSEKFQKLCMCLSIYQAVSSSSNYQRNGTFKSCEMDH